MESIVTITTDKNTHTQNYTITVLPSNSAAKNALIAAEEIIKDFEKDYPGENILSLVFVSEFSGKEMAKMSF